MISSCESKVKLNKQILLNYFLIVISLVILGALFLWAPVCDGLLELADGRLVHMKCFYTSQSASLLAILMLTQAITSLITKKPNPIIVIALGVMIIVLTYQSFLGIGICLKETMACHTSASWLRISGALVIIIGIASLFIKTKKL